MAVYLLTRKRTIRVKPKLISSAYITNSGKYFSLKKGSPDEKSLKNIDMMFCLGKGKL
jgi:hypothetical protein